MAESINSRYLSKMVVQNMMLTLLSEFGNLMCFRHLYTFFFKTFTYENVFRATILYTECPKIYLKSVLYLLKYTENLYLSRCSAGLR